MLECFAGTWERVVDGEEPVNLVNTELSQRAKHQRQWLHMTGLGRLLEESDYCCI
jgi:hypothetical protein